MTVAQMAKMIGTLWLLSDGKGLSFTCRVQDMREVWSKPQCLVSPVDGHGERWVDLTSLSAVPAAATTT
jgi:hypothetical protein